MKSIKNAWRVHCARQDELPPMEKDRYDKDVRELAASAALFFTILLFSIVIMPTLDSQAEARMAQENRGASAYAAKNRRRNVDRYRNST